MGNLNDTFWHFKQLFLAFKMPILGASLKISDYHQPKPIARKRPVRVLPGSTLTGHGINITGCLRAWPVSSSVTGRDSTLMGCQKNF